MKSLFSTILAHYFDAKYRLSVLTKLSNWLKKMTGLFRNKGAKEYADSVNDLAMQLDNLIAEATANAANGVDTKIRSVTQNVCPQRLQPSVQRSRRLLCAWMLVLQ